jgi:hypothetical protein
MTKDEACLFIDNKAGSVRAKYITVAPGQEATYILKGAQARACLAGSNEEFLLIQAEASVTGESLASAAARIVNEEIQWISLASTIEAVRRGGKIAVMASTTEEECLSAYSTTIDALAAMMGGA